MGSTAYITRTVLKVGLNLMHASKLEYWTKMHAVSNLWKRNFVTPTMTRINW